MPTAQSLMENIVANLGASAIIAVITTVLGATERPPGAQVALIGVGAFTVSLLVLMLMSHRTRMRARAETALPLLREVGIHMLVNRPLAIGALDRFGENMVWWRDRTVAELERAGADQLDVSRFRDLGKVPMELPGESPGHAHAVNTASTHVQRLETAMHNLRA